MTMKNKNLEETISEIQNRVGKTDRWKNIIVKKGKYLPSLFNKLNLYQYDSCIDRETKRRLRSELLLYAPPKLIPDYINGLCQSTAPGFYRDEYNHMSDWYLMVMTPFERAVHNTYTGEHDVAIDTFNEEQITRLALIKLLHP